MNAPGTLRPPPAEPILVLSPHLDDGVFGCGRLLASVSGATVATLFAGRPAAGAELTEWDRAAGFAPGEDVIGRRRGEDLRALELLGAHARWLELRDHQYGPSPRLEEVGHCIADLLEEDTRRAVFFPLGLFHSDHRLVSDAALSLLPDHPERRWVAYEDALYRRIRGLVTERVEVLRGRGLSPAPLAFAEAAGAAEAKRAAVARYRSQLLALDSPGRPGHADLAAPETYWQFTEGAT